MDDDDLGERGSARPMSFLAAAAWSLGVGLVASVVMEITDSARPGASSDLVNVTACKVLAYSIFVFAMLRVYAPHASVRDVLGVRAVSPVATLLSIAGGALLYPGLAVIDDYLYKRFPMSAEESELVDKLMQVGTIGQRIVLFAAFVVVIPLGEELFFRGVLFRGLRRGQVEGLAVLSSAALYGLSRGDPRSMPTGLVLGLLVAWLRGRSGSIVPAVLAHVAMNAVPLVPIAMGKGDVEMGPKVAVGGAIAAAICAWGAGLLFQRDGRAERGRLADG